MTTPKVETDVAKWTSSASYNPAWDHRAENAAQLIPRGATVCDIGCGPTRALRGFLHPSCRYLPADIGAWNDGVEKCDLNAGIYPVYSLSKSNVAVMLGVLEYLDEPMAVFGGLAGFVGTVVFSYHPVDFNAGKVRASFAEIVTATRLAGFDRLALSDYNGTQTFFVATSSRAEPVREPLFRRMLRLLKGVGGGRA